ncbi:hypothetical protein TSOC_010616, partial [Tetrabaena socialis]
MAEEAKPLKHLAFVHAGLAGGAACVEKAYSVGKGLVPTRVEPLVTKVEDVVRAYAAPVVASASDSAEKLLRSTDDYFNSPKADVVSELEARAAALEADSRKLREQREAIDGKMRDTEGQMRELLGQSPTLVRRLGDSAEALPQQPVESKGNAGGSSGVEGGNSARHRRHGRGPADASSLLLAGMGCLVVTFIRAFRGQSRQLSKACEQLRATQEQMVTKEQVLHLKEERSQLDKESKVGELSGQVVDAQRELAAARDMCQAAAGRLEQSMSDLSVTETELRAARTQLQHAGRDLTITRAQLEAAEGELGLTRSQNELMK